jgi:hypothetical protein
MWFIYLEGNKGMCEPGNVVGIATAYSQDGPGIELIVDRNDFGQRR